MAFYSGNGDGDVEEFQGMYINPENPNEWSNQPYPGQPGHKPKIIGKRRQGLKNAVAAILHNEGMGGKTILLGDKESVNNDLIMLALKEKFGDNIIIASDEKKQEMAMEHILEKIDREEKNRDYLITDEALHIPYNLQSYVDKDKERNDRIHREIEDHAAKYKRTIKEEYQLVIKHESSLSKRCRDYLIKLIEKNGSGRN